MIVKERQLHGVDSCPQVTSQTCQFIEHKEPNSCQIVTFFFVIITTGKKKKKILYTIANLVSHPLDSLF